MQQTINKRQKVACHWLVETGFAGLRADVYLKQHIGRISRTRVQRIINDHDFLLNEKTLKQSFRVSGGQIATLWRYAPDEKTAVNAFDVKILYEDAGLLIVDKPAGLNIHPSANCLYKTLTYWLRIHYPDQKINPCHRLDKETSGIVICAKEKAMERKVKKAFMNNEINKSYIAIVFGLMTTSKIIKLPLALQKDRGLVRIRMIKDDLGKESTTKVRPLFRDQAHNRTMVLCKPLTGRQHQIRAHLSLIGHSIVGDKLYSEGDEFFDAYCKKKIEISKLEHKRHALHACRVRFNIEGKSYIIKSPIPSEFKALMGSRPYL